MEVALYCPKTGYYERASEPVGRRGDFVTSVSVGSLFGQLLASQFVVWCEHFSGPVQWVESGAHHGRLALDILSAVCERYPALFPRLTYALVEPSESRRAWQRSTLNEFRDRVRWVDAISEIGTAGVSGIIFSNELLDAFPIHRLGWDATSKRWFEWGVDLAQDGFQWCRLTDCESKWPAILAAAGFSIPPELCAVLPDGYVVEVCPAASQWWSDAARVLGRGRLLTIDYGFLAEQFITPERREGTLRAYLRQSVNGDVLASPGEQDLTAHVNFTPVIRAGEKAGLKTESYLSQAEFLLTASKCLWSDSVAPTAPEIRQLQALTHPEHLGRSFRVLVQSRLA